MAVPQPFRRNLRAELERLIRVHSNAETEVDLEAVKAALATYLVGHPDHMDARRQANAMVDDWDKHRRPKQAEDGQLGLFDREAYIPIGPNVRKQMAKARERDLIAWAQISTAEHAADAAAHGERMAYISSRLKAWTNGYRTLEEVERGEFGLDGGEDDPA